jgi:hypothetical protein
LSYAVTLELIMQQHEINQETTLLWIIHMPTIVTI